MATTKEINTTTPFAVLMTGGKQYIAKVGEILKIEKLGDDMKVGDKVVFDQVLMTVNGETVKVGAPTVSGAKVNASITEIGRSQKVDVVHYKQKSKYFKRYGHRQPFMKVQIEKIA